MRGPTQKQVWTFAKEFANAVTAQDSKLLTTFYGSKAAEGEYWVLQSERLGQNPGIDILGAAETTSICFHASEVERAGTGRED